MSKSTVKRICIVVGVFLCIVLYKEWQCPWAKKTGDASRSSIVFLDIDLRRYVQGGAFKELQAGLTDLQKIGIQALCLSPIHTPGEFNMAGKALNPYSIRDYKDIDDRYGTMAEFKSFLKSAHEHHIRVLIDFVSDCTAWDCGLLMQHPEWYAQDESGNIVAPRIGVDDEAKLDYDRHELRKYMIAMLEYWVRDVDVDGFRCIGASNVPDDFWLTAKLQLEKIKSVILIGGDCNSPDRIAVFDYSSSYDIVKGIGDGSAAADTLLPLLRSANLMYTLNYLTTDEPQRDASYFSLHDLAVILAAALPGSPVLQANQVFAQDSTALTTIKKILSFRMAHRALREGSCTAIYNREQRTILAFVRAVQADTVLVVLNFDKTVHTYTIDQNILRAGMWKDIFNSRTYAPEGKTMALQLPAFGYCILTPAR